MIVVSTPEFPWLEVLFACRECGARVRFELKDLGDMSFRARETLENTWVARARCPVCAMPTARFEEVPDATS